MVTTLDLGPLVDLKIRLSRAALFSVLTIYLEGVLTLVLVTQTIVRPATVIVIGPLLVVQAIVIRHQVRRLLDGSLPRAYARHLLLSTLFVMALTMGATGSEGRLTALFIGMLVTVGPSWPAIAMMRAARQVSEQLGTAERRVLMTCLSFDVHESMATRLRAFGGDRSKWTRPLLAAAVALLATLLGLALLVQALGLRMGASIGQVSAIVASWVFYRRLRHAKPRAAELRAHDTRPPVLVLRQFTDDAMGSGWLPAATFEHVIAAELSRHGPTISIGRPGERLQPLGASRDYLTGADWQTSVDALLGQAGLVVLILGGSESLMWEFKTALARCGPAAVLILVPPILKPTDLDRRWASIVETAAQTGTPLPASLPTQRTLAVIFAGHHPVLIVDGARRRRRWIGDRRWSEHRLLLRLRECIRPGDLVSVDDLERFLVRYLPIVRPSRNAQPA